VEVSIRLPARVIEQRIKLWRPDVIWTHMLLWPPTGAPPVGDIVAIVGHAAARGVRVVLHDGDAKQGTRYPRSIASWCALALVNHAYDRSAWGVPVLRWPYFAMAQAAIASAAPELACGLFFAGSVAMSPTYEKRSRLLGDLVARGVGLRMPMTGDNTLDRTAEIAASADAVLGFGRPEVPGWVDTRVFQYPGAGGILLHDDVQGYLEPWEHFVPYVSGSAESIVDALARLGKLSETDRVRLRSRAFSHVQQHHSSLARVRQVFDALGVA